MPPPFQSLEARLDSVSSVFNVSITTNILPLASTTASTLAQFLSASITLIDLTTLGRPIGIFNHSDTSPNSATPHSTAPGSRAHGKPHLDMNKLQLVAAILGALCSIIALVRFLIWAPLRDCIAKERSPKLNTTLERPELQREVSPVSNDEIRRRSWHSSRDLGGDGAEDELAPNATRSSGMSGGLIELFSLPVTIAVVPST